MAFGRLENYFEATRRVMEFRFILPDDPRYKMNFDGTENPYYARPTKLMVVLNGFITPNFLALGTLWNVLIQAFPVILMALGMARPRG